MTDRHAILNSRIPRDGRTITRAERAGLIKCGATVPISARIVRAYDTDYIGFLYLPVDASGMTSLDVVVTIKKDLPRHPPA